MVRIFRRNLLAPVIHAKRDKDQIGAKPAGGFMSLFRAPLGDLSPHGDALIGDGELVVLAQGFRSQLPTGSAGLCLRKAGTMCRATAGNDSPELHPSILRYGYR